MALFSLFGNSETLYFPGCYSQEFLPKKIENYKKILKKLKIDFKTHKSSDFVCCGGILNDAGYEKEVRKNAKEIQSSLIKNKHKKIITNCPLCYNTLNSYKSLLPDWNMETEFIVSSILQKLQDSNYKVNNYFSEPLVYYDSCQLARYSNFIEPPRNLLKLLGFKVLELSRNKEETICCGSCGNLPITNKELAKQICSKFLKSLIKRKIKRIVTADPQAYGLLLEVYQEMKPLEAIEILELSDIICDALGLKRSD